MWLVLSTVEVRSFKFPSGNNLADVSKELATYMGA